MTNRRDTNKRTKGGGLQIPPIYEQTIDINGDEEDGDYSMEWVTPAIGSVYHPNHQRLFNGAERRRSVSFFKRTQDASHFTNRNNGNP